MMIKNYWKVLRFNLKSLIKFEIFFKIITLFIFSPLFLYIFNNIMKSSGFEYLTLDNIVNFLMTPKSIIMILFLIILLTLYTLFDICSIIVIVDASVQNKRISVKDTILISLKKCFITLKSKSILLSFLLLFLIPFLNLGISSSLITSIPIPQYIVHFIKSNPYLVISYVIILLLLSILLLRWIYSLHYHIIDGDNFNEAIKKSINLGKKRHLKDLIFILGIQLALTLFLVLCVLLTIIITLILGKIINGTGTITSLLITTIWIFIIILFIIFGLISTPIGYISISMLFYKHKEEDYELIHHIKVKSAKKKKKSKLLKTINVCIIISTFIGGTIFTDGIINKKYDYLVVNKDVRNIEITAHRGASKIYPENTFSSFIGALELGADWIELDVQQTKDGYIVVTHDKNLKRITGINKNIRETNYKELIDIDVGSFFDEKYAYERIPLFEDVIKWAKEKNIKLNIELKPTGKEKNFEQKVLDIIKSNDYKDNCIVASLNYKVLENIKEIDPSINTLYVITFVYGDISSFDKANDFSIEASNITKSLVDSIHDNGKKLYVWTVNDSDMAKKLIHLGVDNIITDNITLVREEINNNETTNILDEYINYISLLIS